MLNRQSVHVAMLLWGAIFNLIAALCMYMGKGFEKNKRIWMISMQICSAALLGSDALAWVFRGNMTSMGYYGVRISNFIVFVLSDVILLVFHGYVCSCLFGDAKPKNIRNSAKNKSTMHKINMYDVPDKRIILVYAIAVVGVVLVIISQFTHMYYYIDAANVYHRNSAHVICMIVPMIGMLLDFSMIMQYRDSIDKDIFVSLMSYLALPFIAAVILIFYYGISLVNLAICISTILMFVVSMLEQNRVLASSERKVADLKIELMLSQIAPHFIYNALTTISQMCESDPKLAKETTIEFSQYLRGNMNSLSRKECIPFPRELEHTKCYTAIEKKRFGDRINVVYDVKDKNFLIPSLTLQPLVENAIKHGLCMKKGGGTVKIRTERTADYVYVVVSDDGVGFEQKAEYSDDEDHIGLKNVESRLKSMCGGELRIESVPGRGTMAVIAIPDNDNVQGDRNYEDNSCRR